MRLTNDQMIGVIAFGVVVALLLIIRRGSRQMRKYEQQSQHDQADAQKKPVQSSQPLRSEGARRLAEYEAQREQSSTDATIKPGATQENAPPSGSWNDS